MHSTPSLGRATGQYVFTRRCLHPSWTSLFDTISSCVKATYTPQKDRSGFAPTTCPQRRFHFLPPLFVDLGDEPFH